MVFASFLHHEETPITGWNQSYVPGVNPMQYLEMMPVAVAAWQYSLAYMICGGGVLGAIVVFFGAKMLGK
jgi:hypothetical protein